MFDKLVAKLVFGGTYRKHADVKCSATTMRARRDEWIAAGVFHRLEQIVLDAYDRIVGLKLGDASVDGEITKAAAGSQAAGKSPVDRRKLGIKWSRLTKKRGIQLGCVIAGANRHDSPLLRPILERLSRFGFDLPDDMRLHLDAGYDSNVTRELLNELGFDGHIQPKGEIVPINRIRRSWSAPTPGTAAASTS